MVRADRTQEEIAMERITWDEARRELVALALPEVVLTAFERPRDVPETLQWLMRDPGELFEEPTHFDAHPPGAITPLWAVQTGHIVVGHRRAGGAPGFLRFLLEEAELVEEGLSFQQLVVRDLVSVWEYEDDESNAEVRVREAATLLAFTAVDRLVEELLSTSRRTVQEYDAFLAGFRATLGGPGVARR